MVENMIVLNLLRKNALAYRKELEDITEKSKDNKEQLRARSAGVFDFIEIIDKTRREYDKL